MSWTVETIEQQFIESGFFARYDIVAQRREDSLLLTFTTRGDLPVVLVVGEKQILAEVALVERDEFTDPKEIDYRLLTTHKYLPLSCIAIQSIAGTDWYVLFGALSIHSKIEVIGEELIELVNNTFSVIDALEPLYKFNN
ncbi:DUF2170 family protein [Bowmanella sp. JS7-9]|uniref:DUF2170 family protein n=1 Tax=Pseudobowmanella zhangzhouensis TaxID=1537679 RepID=A0ABW1XMT6_9ALTE|nr:DUF2170 family protein [Bowmanella sp. JS7-9]TBX23720.1 hypothetical protein TK45_06390 [Bowmanella sp. JS7-9]